MLHEGGELVSRKEEIADLVAKVSLDGSGFQNGVSKLNRQLKVVRSEFKVAEASIDKFGNKTKYLETKADSLTQELTIQQGMVKKLEEAFEESVKEKGRDAKATQNLEVKLNRARAAMKSTEKQIDNVNDELREQQGLVTMTGDAWDKNQEKVKTNVKSMIKELDGLHHAMTGVVLASGAGLGIAAYQAGSFEQALANVKAVSGATEEDMQKLSEVALDLGENTKYSARQVLSGAEELIKAGVTMEDVIGGSLKASLDLATAGEIDLANAAEIASTALNAFSDDNIDTSRAADILAGAANASATNVSQMQQGLQQSSAASAAAGLSFEETATALATLAQNGLKGSDAGTSLKTMLLRLTPDTKNATEAMRDLGIITGDGVNKFYKANGELKDFNEVVAELHEAMDDLNPQERTKYLKEMFGTDAYRAGAIFFKETANGIEDMNKAMNNVTAAEVAAEKMDTLFGTIEELKSSLQTLGVNVAEDELQGLADIVKEITGFVRDMNPEVVAIGLKSAAAAGGVGLLATSIAKVSRALMLLRANPIGLAITGIALLTGAIVGATEAYKENQKVSFEKIDAMDKEVKATDELINRFDQLKAKNQLSNDEMLRYLDIQAELEQTSAPDRVKALKDEQNNLLEKSNLTNQEMERFLELNQKVIDKAPSTKKAISSEGEAYAFNTDELKKFNQEKLRQLEIEAQRETEKAVNQITEAYKEQKELIATVKRLDKEIETTENRRSDLNYKIKERKEEIDKLEKEMKENSDQDLSKTRVKLQQARSELELLQRNHMEQQGILENKREQFIEDSKSLDKTREEIRELEQTLGKFEQIILSQANITAERGKGLQKINEEIGKLEIEKRQLDDLLKKGEITRTQYDDQNKKIDEQLVKLSDAKTELQQINEVAGRQVYKTVQIQEKPDNYWDSLNKKLAAPVDKYINIFGKIHTDTQSVPGYAKGTGDKPHPGGLAWVGEEGPELLNLPKGAEVLPHEQSVSLAKKLGQVPGYARGTGSWSLVEGNEPELVETSDGSITKKIRDIRKAEIKALEKQIDYLTREEASIQELNAAKEKSIRLDELQNQKKLEYKHRLEEQKVVLNLLAQAHKKGELNTEEYNERVAEATVKLEELKRESQSFQRSLSEPKGMSGVEKQRSIRESIISMLDTEIRYLKREGATQSELNQAKEKQRFLDDYRSEQQVDYQKQIDQTKVKIEELNQAYRSGAIEENQYNEKIAEAIKTYENLQQNLYQLKEEMASDRQQSLNTTIQNAKRQLEEGKAAVDEFGQEVMYALQNKYQAQMEVEIKAEEDSYNNLISSLQSDLSGLEKEWATQDYQENMDDLQGSLEAARTPAERKRIQEKIDQARKQRNRELKKQSIQDEIERAREERAEVVSSIEKKYEAMMKQENIEAEARKMIIRNNEEELLNLLDTYNSDWQDAGRSFGEKMVEGLESQMTPMREAVQRMVNIAHGAIQGFKSFEDFAEKKNVSLGNEYLKGLKEAGSVFKPDRTIASGSSVSSFNQPPAPTTVILEADGREIGRTGFNTTNEMIGRTTRVQARVRGNRS